MKARGHSLQWPRIGAHDARIGREIEIPPSPGRQGLDLQLRQYIEFTMHVRRNATVEERRRVRPDVPAQTRKSRRVLAQDLERLPAMCIHVRARRAAVLQASKAFLA